MFIFKDFTKNVSLKAKDVYVDNMVFRLHYRLTFWFLMAATVIVCTRQYIGEHIDCIAADHLKNVINTYCFIMTTYTVVGHHNHTKVSLGGAAHPGVGPDPPGAEIKRHSYYQWVPFVLFFQALFFYVPHYIWKAKEKGRVKAMVDGMTKVWLTAQDDVEIKGYKIQSAVTKNEKIQKMKSNLMLLRRFGVSRDWARYLVLCEVLNAVNLVVQIWLVDVFLGGQFISLGYDWFHTDNEAELLDFVFPKMTKCVFKKYGASGSLQTHDALCVMALNIINEKIYVILWFWFFSLLVVTCLGLVWRLLTMMLHALSPAMNRLVWSQVSPGPSPDQGAVRVVTRNFCFSDWLFLYYVGKNMDGSLFREVLHLLAEELGSTPASSLPSSSSSSPYPRLYPKLQDETKDKLLNLDEPDTRSAGESSC